MANVGYKGWKEQELSQDEKDTAENITKLVKATLGKAGFTEEEKDSLSIKFEKATLTIDAEEAASGAFHTLADGKPFYSYILTGGSPRDENIVTYYMLMMMQALGNGTMSLSDPMVLRHDFREDLDEQANKLWQASNQVAKQLSEMRK